MHDRVGAAVPYPAGHRHPLPGGPGLAGDNRAGRSGDCRRPSAGWWAVLLLVPLLLACGQQPATPATAATPGRPPGGAAATRSALAGAATRSTVGREAPPPPAPTSGGATVTAGLVGGACPGGLSPTQLLHYRGRSYRALVADAGAALRLDHPVGRTFSRWQSSELFPAGAAIHEVAGWPAERLLAVQGRGRSAFFCADEQALDLPSTQVVRGTVRSVGPVQRWGSGDAGPRFYLFAAIAVERTLHGLIPAGEADVTVLQLGGSPDGGVPLAPGNEVLLFLYPGRWATTGGDLPGTPPGTYYLVVRYWAYLIADGQVTPLDPLRDNDAPVPIEEFEAGVAETFRGVQTLDPGGPKPTPAPTPRRRP